MHKLIYIFSILAVSSLFSCKKKSDTPTPATTTTSKSVDTTSGKIFTIAGNGYNVGKGGGFSGDGGAASLAELAGPSGVALDAAGNIYISSNNRIRKVNTSGIISTIAGNGAYGYSGDGGSALVAEFHFPYGIALDGVGNIYISDFDNQCIRKVTPGGLISTCAGNGIEGYSGDGGSATGAEINNSFGLTVDVSGNIYIADAGNMRIRWINTNGIITTVAGNGSGGYSGDGGPATEAGLSSPNGVALDVAGNMYIADYDNNRIRMVNTSGIISTIAGNGYGSPFDGGYSGDGGEATSAELFNPYDVVVDGSGNIYISDADNDRIRMINPTGIITTIAGTGIDGYSGDGGPATAADIGFTYGIALDQSANIYITNQDRIRIVYK